MSVRVTLSPLVYGQEGLNTAIEAYSAFCTVVVVANTPKGCEVEIKAAPDMDDEVRVSREFLNYLLDVSLENHLKKL